LSPRTPLLFCHPEPLEGSFFFCRPERCEGSFFSLSLPQGGDFSLRSKRQGRGVAPSLSFFVAPSEARGLLFSLSLPQGGDFSLRSKRQGRGVAPNAPFVAPNASPFLSPRASLFFCRPEASAEGSLGAYAPREDIPMPRPERSEGCLANACYLPAHENLIHPCKYQVLFYIKI
jgi:hypothetical protein